MSTIEFIQYAQGVLLPCEAVHYPEIRDPVVLESFLRVSREALARSEFVSKGFVHCKHINGWWSRQEWIVSEEASSWELWVNHADVDIEIEGSSSNGPPISLSSKGLPCKIWIIWQNLARRYSKWPDADAANRDLEEEISNTLARSQFAEALRLIDGNHLSRKILEMTGASIEIAYDDTWLLKCAWLCEPLFAGTPTDCLVQLIEQLFDRLKSSEAENTDLREFREKVQSLLPSEKDY